MTIYNICNKYLHINILYIYIYTYSSPFLLATPQSQCLMVMGRDGGLSNLCHSCGLWAYVSEEGVQKTFPGPGCLSSEDGQSDYGIWHFLVNLYIYIYIYIYSIYLNPCILQNLLEFPTSSFTLLRSSGVKKCYLLQEYSYVRV